MPSRRRALQTLTSAGLVGLAGCSALADSGPDPDAGRESYGLDVRNNTNYEHRVTVRVEKLAAEAAEPEAIFGERLALRGGARRSWDHVLTDPVEHIVRAEVGAGEADYERTLRRITVGQDFSPAVADVAVIVHSITIRREARRATAVRIEPGSDAE